MASSMKSGSSRRKAAPGKLRIVMKGIVGKPKADDGNGEEEELDHSDREVEAEGNGIPDDLPEGTVVVQPEAVEDVPAKKKREAPVRIDTSVLDNVSCTSCGRQLNPYKSSALQKHPELKVVICRRCCKFLSSGEIGKDKDGIDEQCRWCGEGGRLVVCDHCSSAFCKACVMRNFNRSEFNNINDQTSWKCYLCDKAPLQGLRENYRNVRDTLKALQAKEKAKQAGASAASTKDQTPTSNGTKQSGKPSDHPVSRSASVSSSPVHRGPDDQQPKSTKKSETPQQKLNSRNNASERVTTVNVSEDQPAISLGDLKVFPESVDVLMDKLSTATDTFKGTLRALRAQFHPVSPTGDEDEAEQFHFTISSKMNATEKKQRCAKALNSTLQTYFKSLKAILTGSPTLGPIVSVGESAPLETSPKNTPSSSSSTTKSTVKEPVTRHQVKETQQRTGNRSSPKKKAGTKDTEASDREKSSSEEAMDELVTRRKAPSRKTKETGEKSGSRKGTAALISSSEAKDIVVEKSPSKASTAPKSKKPETRGTGSDKASSENIDVDSTVEDRDQEEISGDVSDESPAEKRSRARKPTSRPSLKSSEKAIEEISSSDKDECDDGNDEADNTLAQSMDASPDNTLAQSKDASPENTLAQSKDASPDFDSDESPSSPQLTSASPGNNSEDNNKSKGNGEAAEKQNECSALPTEESNINEDENLTAKFDLINEIMKDSEEDDESEDEDEGDDDLHSQSPVSAKEAKDSSKASGKRGKTVSSSSEEENKRPSKCAKTGKETSVEKSKGEEERSDVSSSDILMSSDDESQSTTRTKRRRRRKNNTPRTQKETTTKEKAAVKVKKLVATKDKKEEKETGPKKEEARKKKEDCEDKEKKREEEEEGEAKKKTKKEDGSEKSKEKDASKDKEKTSSKAKVSKSKENEDDKQDEDDVDKEIEKLSKRPVIRKRKAAKDSDKESEEEDKEKEDAPRPAKTARTEKSKPGPKCSKKPEDLDDLSSDDEVGEDKDSVDEEEDGDEPKVTFFLDEASQEDKGSPGETENEVALNGLLEEMKNGKEDDDDDGDDDDDDSDNSSSDDSDVPKTEKKEKKEKTAEKEDLSDKENDDDNDDDDDDNDDDISIAKTKRKVIKTKLLDTKLSDSDSDIESSKTKAKEEKDKEFQEESDKSSSSSSVESDIDDDDDVSEEDSENDDSESKKKKKGKKKKKTKKKGKGKKKKGKKGGDNEDEEDEDDDEEEDEEGGGKKGKGKRRRIKKMADSSDDDDDDKDSDDDDEDGENKTTPGRRKKIRKVMSNKKLEDSTRAAAKAEEKRRKRIAMKQREFNIETITDDNNPMNCPITTKLILEPGKEEGDEPVIQVNKQLIRKLKPHQVDAVQFMWDCLYESVKRSKKEEGAGCILAHCMGLGKTLSVISFVHTILSHAKILGHKTALVVCPLNTVLNWQNEWGLWLDEEDQPEVWELASCKQNPARLDMLKEWKSIGGIMIIGYEMYRNLTTGARIKNKRQKKVFQETLVDPGPDLVICDEGHILKNEASAISKAMNQMKTRRRVVLTGTPLQNNLNEYHCMLSFVKPRLLGTRKEFNNRFISPIGNGQCTDSTQRDVKLMKARAHVLHEMLAGCVQRRDYSALTKFLPPKQEYVMSVRLTNVQIDLYNKYLELSGQGVDGVFNNKGARLFKDYQNLMKIWTHPWVLKLAEIRDELKAKYDDEDSFIDDESMDERSFSSSNSSSDEDKYHSNSGGEGTSAGAGQKRGTRRTRAKARRQAGEDSDPEEVIAEWKSKSRGENVKGEPVEVEVDKSVTNDWWSQFVTEDDKTKLELSNKLFLLFEILRMCEEIGDKVLIFSQSILSLNIIESFLETVDSKFQQESEKIEKMEEEETFGKCWTKNLDYYRMDGTTSAQNRQAWAKSFNDLDNYRARLFLISTKAGGLGINLVAANRVIIFDASWNPSHDVQSIFRVYRFGQTKPCYIYRFLAQGTMEEKIYERQVTKLSLSQRVVDEHQIERHFSASDLKELYNFKPDKWDDGSEKPTLALPKDPLLAEILTQNKHTVQTFHEHDSLLENQIEQTLTEEEKKAAWEEYENEKKGIIIRGPGMAERSASWPMMAAAQILSREQITATVQALRQQLPDVSEELFQLHVQQALRRMVQLKQDEMRRVEMLRMQEMNYLNMMKQGAGLSHAESMAALQGMQGLQGNMAPWLQIQRLRAMQAQMLQGMGGAGSSSTMNQNMMAMQGMSSHRISNTPEDAIDLDMDASPTK